MIVKLISVVLLFSIVSAKKIRYDNYTLYRIQPRNEEQLQVLTELYKDELRYNFWDTPSKYVPVNILSSPANKAELETILRKYDIASEVATSNIQEKFDKEKIGTYVKSSPISMTWNKYYKLEDIYSWLDDLIQTYPETSEIIGGTSYEGRSIKGIKISHGGTGKRAVFVEGGIHAREWISPATVNFITNELLTSKNEDIQAIARDYDWYIFPVTNPDGYSFTFEENRLWRKNRRPTGQHYGVDLNRNWNANWLVVGASDNPSSDSYAGHGPFSEIETRSLSRYMMDMREDIELYLSFHSFGQILLLPFGNTTEPLANYDDAMEIGRKALEVLEKRHGTPYTIGNIAEAIYPATGGSIDWVKERLKVPLVYCYELRDRQTFVLPEDQILPTGEETMDSIIEMIKQAKRLDYMPVDKQ